MSNPEWEYKLDFQALWIECAESHTDIEMELRDLKIHHAKVREQTLDEVFAWINNNGDCPLKVDLAFESKFLPKRENKE